MKILSHKKSFTLVEILIYVAVLAIVVSAVSSFFIWTIRTNIKARAMREVFYNTERAMMVMTQEIKEAKIILKNPVLCRLIFKFKSLAFSPAKRSKN